MCVGGGGGGGGKGEGVKRDLENSRVCTSIKLWLNRNILRRDSQFH